MLDFDVALENSLQLRAQIQIIETNPATLRSSRCWIMLVIVTYILNMLLATVVRGWLQFCGFDRDQLFRAQLQIALAPNSCF